MKISEIQLGNYFLYKGKVVQVKGISTDSNKTVFIKYLNVKQFGENRETVSPRTLKPISLTEEIFRKSGFCKGPHDNWRIYKPDKYEVNYYDYISPMLLIKGLGYPYCGFKGFEVFYAHQLQQIFNICKIDINVKI